MAKRAPRLALCIALGLAPACKKQPRGAPRETPTAAPAQPALALPLPSPTPGEISGPVGLVGGPFVGFGMRLVSTTRGVGIAAVLPDSPASEAGLREGDLIVAIDGESTLGWSATQVGDRLRGAAGTEAGLDLERGIDPVQVRMVRRLLPAGPPPAPAP